MSTPPAAANCRSAARLLCVVLLWPALGLAEAVERVEGQALYQLPEPGSYELPVIDRVGHHELLSTSGEHVPLLDIAQGSCAVVSFVYANCSDAGGCPLVLASLRQIAI
jgi:cytochrome c peroxidase